MDKNNAAELWNQPGTGVYPIAGFTYVMVYKDLSFLKEQAKASALAEFLDWASHDGQKLAPDLNYCAAERWRARARCKIPRNADVVGFAD